MTIVVKNQCKKKKGKGNGTGAPFGGGGEKEYEKSCRRIQGKKSGPFGKGHTGKVWSQIEVPKRPGCPKGENEKEADSRENEKSAFKKKRGKVGLSGKQTTDVKRTPPKIRKKKKTLAALKKVRKEHQVE